MSDPGLYNRYDYLVKETNNRYDMEKYMRNYFRYNHQYINRIDIDYLIDNYDKHINEDFISQYYIIYDEDMYKLYYRIKLSTVSLEDFYRFMLYEKGLNLIYGNSFKEYDRKFATFEDAVEYVDSICDSSVNKYIKHPLCEIYYENFVIEDRCYILLVTSFLNEGGILMFDTKVWDLNTILNKF